MSAITEENFGCNIFAGQGSKYSAEIVSGSATRDGDASDYFKECKAPIIKVTFNQDNTSIDANTIVVKTSKGGWAGNLTCQKLGSNITNNCLKVNSDGKTGSLTTYGAGEYDASPTTAPTCSSNSTPSEGSSWYDITNNPYIYFNNTYANYGIVAVLLGRKENYENNNSVPTGSESINMSKIENTNLFYVQKQSWNHFTTFLFIQENGWSWEGNTVTNRINSTSNYTNTYNVSMNGGYHMFTASCGSNGANLSYANSNSHTDLLHKKQNVQIMLSTDGGATYSKSASYLGTIKASRYTMSSANAVSNSEKTLSASSSYATGVISSTITFTASATQAGYEFVGWGITNAGPTKTAANAKGTYDTYKYLVGGEATIYAYYKSSTYTVTYDYNGGSGNVASATCAQGGTVTLPSPNAREGYTFDGWYTAATDGTLAGTASASYKPTDNITLYAHWTENKYPVTITAGAGGIVSPDGEQQVGSTPVTITATPNTGYDFVDWTASTNQIAIADINAATTTVTATAAGTVTAHFQKKTYTVTFNTNGHGNEVAAQNVTSGEKATVPTPAPTATGFIFGGWYTEAGCTNKYDFSTAVTKNITLYAKWTEDYSTKTFYYFDDEKTGWDGEVGKAMINTKEYAYIQRPAYNNIDNKFKIFPDNPKKGDETKIANDENIAKNNLKGDIELGDTDKDWHNILMPATTKDYYVILYYPNTTTNPSNDFLVAASYSLPNMEKYKLTFGVIGENGNLTAKSGGVSISSGAEVAFATLTAEPAENYEVAGWYSDAEGTQKIDAAGTNTTYNLTLTAATSVYVKFKRKEKTYWYNGSDKGWTKGESVALTNDENGVYAYYKHSAHSSNEVQFCIFEANSWNDKTPKYNGNHKNNGFYGANIDLGTAGDGNAIVPKQNTDYFIILYFPNTTYNPNDNYILCASTTLPKFTDPVTVSFGVVGKTGGSLTAKSGNSTIESGTAVSYVTFTATPIAGYAVEGWYSDAEGTKKINAAGNSTTYTLSPVTVENCNVYVKFKKVSAIYFKPNDQNHWGKKMVYMFSGAVWDTYNNPSKGVSPNSSSRKEYYAMEKVNDSVYYHTLIYANECSHVAFNWGDQNNNNNFDDCEAIYRSDFSTKLPFYISEKGQGYEEWNKHDNKSTKYFNKGVWMAYGEEKSGYSLVLRDPTKADEKQLTYHDFIVDEAYGYTSSVTVALEADKTYSFQIKNLNDTWYKPVSAGLRCSAENHQFTMYEKTEKYEIVIDTKTDGVKLPAGNYTFQLNLVNGKVEVNVLIPSNEYRLVYVEKDKDNIKKYHPSHVIKQRAGGTEKAPLYDTISMHVRPMIRKWNETENKYDTTANSNACEVQLQKRNAGTNNWTVVDAQKVDVKTQFTESGVYNFVLKQVDGEEVTLPTELIHPYTGQYYILTDAFDSNWSLTAARDNIKQRFWYSNYADNKESFSHYCCKWTNQNTNLEFVVANDYSYCITDTLIRTKYEADHNYVNEKDELNENANVRFMWQHYDNTTDRAYVGAGGSAVKLISTNSQIKEGAELNLDDQQNWVYAKEVHAQINTRVKIEAFYHNYTQYFKGKEGDFNNEANTEYLIKGIDTSQPYKIRVIYDFKTNHLICAWMPEGVISGEQVIESDIMLIRKDTCDATQITFNNANLQSVKTAYGVVELTKAYLGNTNYTSKARANYWISFPFDVNLSDVFGNGTYGTHFGVQYYDGAERAEKGQWIDSPTRWKFYKDPTNVVLKKGLGYVLVVLPDKLLNEQFTHGNSSIRFYFPSTNTEPIDIDGTVQEVIVPEHKCTIDRNTRYIYDSNWNIIGVPTWANRDDMGNPQVAVQEGKWKDFKVGFYYKANTSNGKFEASEATELSFKSMYAYLVQWAGTIKWQEKKYDGEVHPKSPAQQALQARRNAAAEEGEEELSAPEQYTLRLTLRRGEQQLDHTYVRLQEGNVTTDFDLNYDMTKIINSGANIYSLVGTQQIQCAANVQPLQEEARTISIPLGVVADQDGLYTFSLPDGTEGMNVSIADSETGMAHNLALGDYQTALTKGTYEGRFALEIQPRQEVSTGCEQTDAAGKTLRKVLINGNLYILRDGKAYTATGNEL